MRFICNGVFNDCASRLKDEKMAVSPRQSGSIGKKLPLAAESKVFLAEVTDSDDHNRGKYL